MRKKSRALALVALILSSLIAFSFVPTTALGQNQVAVPAVMRWAYYVPQQTSVDSYKQNFGSLDVLSPFYFTLRPDGSIQGSDKPDITNLARSRGVKVVPMLQNQASKDDFSRQLNDPATVKRILDQIESLVVANNYDGFHIDFENINPGDRSALTNFMAQLHARLKAKGKLTTQALVAKTREVTTGFGGAYDYAALAAYLDYAVVMAYDYHYRGGEDGPVAPISWVNSVAAYSASQLTPGKVILGIPLYGYDWNLTKGGLATARGYDDTLDVVQRYKGTTGYDATYQEAFADYTANAEKHRVWYQTPRGLAARIEAARKNNLGGFGMWRLGHEAAAFWPIIREATLPTAKIQPFASTPAKIYFSQTGHSLSGVFKAYWEKYGGLAQFGYPWTEEFQEVNPADGKVYTVQYFERARFEYHPEYKGTPSEVLLGLLGRQVTEGRSSEIPFQRVVAFSNNPNALYFEATGHSLSYGFKQYWEANGGLAIYGYPISEEFQERSPTDGKIYTVQYFERNRFEYHPEFKATKYEVLLGLLGNQIMVENDWLTL